MKIETRSDGRKVCPYDHHSAEFGQNYREIHREVREAGPVVWSENYGGFWVVTDYESNRKVLMDPETFTIGPVEGAREFGPILPQPDAVKAMAETPGMFFFYDGEQHDAPRAVLSGPFSKRRVAAQADMIQSQVDRVLDRVLPRGEFDVVYDVGMPVIAGVVCEMLGFDLEEPAAIFRAMEGPSQYARSDEDGSEEVKMSLSEALAYVGEVVRARKEEPRDDLISALHQANDGQFSVEEVQGIATQMVLASLENPQALLGHCMFYLADRPELRAELRADPSKTSDFVVEGVRNFNPGMTTARTATRDVELGGMQIRKGDRILVALAAASADPAMYEHPDEFDPDRRGFQHIALGAGIHNCLGQHVVQIAVAAMVQGLLERVEDYSFDPDKVIRNTDKSANDVFDRAWMRVTALREPATSVAAPS